MIRPCSTMTASNTHLSAHRGDDPRGDGLCRHEDPELFFPDKGSRATEAKAVCERCPLKGVCLEHALETKEKDGVWGGTTPEERKKLLAKGKAAS